TDASTSLSRSVETFAFVPWAPGLCEHTLSSTGLSEPEVRSSRVLEMSDALAAAAAGGFVAGVAIEIGVQMCSHIADIALVSVQWAAEPQMLEFEDTTAPVVSDVVARADAFVPATVSVDYISGASPLSIAKAVPWHLPVSSAEQLLLAPHFPT